MAMPDNGTPQKKGLRRPTVPIYTMTPGDALAPVAAKHGHLWQTIWNRAENAELKELRKDPNILFEGDKIFIPDVNQKQVTVSTGARHCFRVKQRYVDLRVRLIGFEGARKHEAYRLEAGGVTREGKTDGDGMMVEQIPVSARSAQLFIGEDAAPYHIELGALDPLSEVRGRQQQLSNLGYRCPESGKLDEPTRRAIEDFQADSGLEETGEFDEPTLSALSNIHQS